MKMRHWTLTMNIGVDNLFNYVDRTPFGRNRATSTPGRNFYASALIKFKNRGAEQNREKNIFLLINLQTKYEKFSSFI